MLALNIHFSITVCNGQMCGFFNNNPLQQSSVVYNNSLFNVSISSCEEIYIKSTANPISSMLVSLKAQNTTITKQV